MLVGAWLLIGTLPSGGPAAVVAASDLLFSPLTRVGIVATLLLTLTALAALLAQLRWRALGWATEGDYLIVRHGLLGQQTQLFPLRSLIAVELQQTWLQRRRHVATLHLHLANGPVTLPWLDSNLANALANVLLAGVEADEGQSVVDCPRKA